MCQTGEEEELGACPARLSLQLLFEKIRQSGGDGGPAKSVVVDVSAVAAQKGLMGEETVFALVDGYAEPVTAANFRLDFEEQLAADSE